MNLSLQFWAKLGNETWPEKYHPVICHLIDVAVVTQYLWDAVFRPQFRRWLATLAVFEDNCARRPVSTTVWTNSLASGGGEVC